eukprot:scaffold2002_cov328-Prasinococcus_capsulatus_cf.AAC.2
MARGAGGGRRGGGCSTCRGSSRPFRGSGWSTWAPRTRCGPPRALGATCSCTAASPRTRWPSCRTASTRSCGAARASSCPRTRTTTTSMMMMRRRLPPTGVRTRAAAAPPERRRARRWRRSTRSGEWGTTPS